MSSRRRSVGAPTVPSTSPQTTMGLSSYGCSLDTRRSDPPARELTSAQAIKEFSKARLRKRARSNILRQGPRRPVRIAERESLNAPLSPHFADLDADAGAGSHNDALYLIREEIAIMKKLNHFNLVQLIEVLDDPEEDSLYIVLEMCRKGVVMKIGLGEQATPYPEDMCRTWFRDLILGTEYRECQGAPPPTPNSMYSPSRA